MKKTITRRRLMELTAAFAASSAVAHSVQAQAYPNRTIRLIAPFPAGGGTDSAARILAARLSEVLGQQVVVDNRPGAGSNIGAACDQPLSLCFTQLRFRHRPRAGVIALPLSKHPRGGDVVAADFGPQFHRLRQGQSRQSDLFLPRGSAPRRTCPVNCSSAWPASSSSTCPIAAPGPAPLPTPSPAASIRLSTLPALCCKPCAPGNCAGSPSPR